MRAEEHTAKLPKPELPEIIAMPVRVLPPPQRSYCRVNLTETPPAVAGAGFPAEIKINKI
jgi:hypothetical protein